METVEEGATEEFTPITTQEEFNKAIQSRLARAEASSDRKFKAKYKEAFDKAAKFDELEEANKTELQKMQDALTKATTELDQYRHRAEVAGWIAEVAEESGIPANLLRGETKEEIQAHAETLKTYYDGKKPGRTVVKSDGFAVASTKGQSTGAQFAAALDGIL